MSPEARLCLDYLLEGKISDFMEGNQPARDLWHEIRRSQNVSGFDGYFWPEDQPTLFASMVPILVNR